MIWLACSTTTARNRDCALVRSRAQCTRPASKRGSAFRRMRNTASQAPPSLSRQERKLKEQRNSDTKIHIIFRASDTKIHIGRPQSFATQLACSLSTEGTMCTIIGFEDKGNQKRFRIRSTLASRGFERRAFIPFGKPDTIGWKRLPLQLALEATWRFIFGELRLEQLPPVPSTAWKRCGAQMARTWRVWWSI